MLLITCNGFSSMQVIMRTHATLLIQHTHQGEYKKKAQLKLNKYFIKVMHMTTNAHLKINTNTMHQFVVDLIAPKKNMHMLEDKLEGGATHMHRDAMVARVHFSKMSSWSTCTPSWMTKLGINITSMSKSWSHHNRIECQ